MNVPNYAATDFREAFDGRSRGMPLRGQPFPPLARLLAEFHTSLNVVGLRYFGGNMDRFMVFCLLLRTSLSHPARQGTISVHSAAMSLGRPFETVRRHVCALLDRNVCERTPTGVMLSRPYWERPGNWRQLRYTHDCFVRLIADGVDAGVIPMPQPRPTSGTSLGLNNGVCAATDLILALVDANRRLCPESIDLAIFSAVLHANLRAFDADRAATPMCGPDDLQPRHAVRIAQLAGALSMPDTTVRRRVVPYTGANGLYRRGANGLLIAADRLRPCLDSRNVEGERHGSIRLIIQRAVANGLSLHHPERSYCDGRPPPPDIG